jgi:hypothetical protein
LLIPFGLVFYYGLAVSSSNRVRYQIFSNIVNGFNFFLLLLALSLGIVYLSRKNAKLIGLKTLVVALIVFDLFSFGWQWYVEEKKPQEYYPADPVVEFLKKDRDFFRVTNDDVLSPNAGSVYGIFTTSGSNPLSLKEYESMANREDLLNVKYILTRKEPDSNKYTLVYSDGERKVFERKKFTPRVFVPSAVLPAEKADFLEGSDFDAGKAAVLYGADSLLKRTNQSGKGTAKITNYTPNEITVRTEMQKDGFVVLSEIFYPGWKAYVDGESSQVYQANKLLRAVFVPKGKHKVRFSFQPSTYAWGLRIAGFTWLTIALIAGFGAARFVTSQRKRNA